MSRKSRHRRAKNTGSVFYSPRLKLWVARGPKGRPERTGHTQAEAIRRLAEARPPGPDATVAEWGERWLSTLGVRSGTRTNYENTVRNYVVPQLGHTRLAALTAHDIEVAARRWAADCGPNTVRQHVTHLGVMLGAAVRAGILTRNPVASMRKPKRVRRTIAPFSSAELMAIIGAATDPRARPVALLAATGCRLGEAVALDVPDWDAATGKLGITKTATRRGGEDRIGPPKTQNSIRTITVPDAARPAVEAAVAGRKAGPVFQGPRGGRMDLRRVYKWWRRILEKLGLAYRKPHTLRHSVATEMVAAGFPLANVAEYLGDTLQTVVATYVHPVKGVDPGQLMNGLLCGGNEVGKGRGRKP